MDQSYFLELALYNQWANKRLYKALEGLSDQEFRQDCDVYFKSLQGTLNHILVADLAWLGRLQKTPRTDLTLNMILHETVEDLWAARQAQDEEIIRFCQGLTPVFVSSVLHYQSISGGAYEAPVRTILAHVFNHQTHHRGHAHACLTRLGKEAPDMDIIYYHLGL
ncbi:DinB family protein [Terasakiella pusilla]|uniref:DinB family protein n=1 Tax=Terasakiella pusilla TaxID=64973 RepID=UPI003AA83F35